MGGGGGRVWSWVRRPMTLYSRLRAIGCLIAPSCRLNINSTFGGDQGASGLSRIRAARHRCISLEYHALCSLCSRGDLFCDNWQQVIYSRRRYRLFVLYLFLLLFTLRRLGDLAIYGRALLVHVRFPFIGRGSTSHKARHKEPICCILSWGATNEGISVI